MSSIPMTFERGTHPHDGKDFSESCTVQVFPSPGEVRIPLIQHIGAPAKECVKTGEIVTYGQKIGERGSFVSAHVFASLPGKVKRIGNVTIPNGRHVPAVFITTDNSQFDSETLWNRLTDLCPYSVEDFTPEQIEEKIANAGLVGLGGAAFPTHVKFVENEKKPVDTLLVNGCECEPYLTADHRLMVEAAEAIVAGARFAARAVEAKRIIVCVEENKPDAMKTLEEVVSNLGDTGDTEISVAHMITKYPQGGEKQLIFATTKRKVPLGKLPMDVGCAVMNVGTAATTAMAVLYDAPLTHRIVTVTGGGIGKPANLFVPIGTSIRELIDFCGGLKEDARRVIAGGPMMGFALGSLDIPVTKATNGISVLTAEELARTPETSCVRCGHCVSVCPMNLIPTRLAQSARGKQWKLFEKYHPLACLECGSCAFECPASIPLVQLIRLGKVELQHIKQREASK